MTLASAQPDSMSFRFSVKTDGDECIVEVHRLLIATNANPVRDRVVREIDDGHKLVTIDLTHCDEIDYAHGLPALFSIARRAKKVGGSCTIVGANPIVRALFAKYPAVEAAFEFAVSEVPR